MFQMGGIQNFLGGMFPFFNNNFFMGFNMPMFQMPSFGASLFCYQPVAQGATGASISTTPLFNYTPSRTMFPPMPALMPIMYSPSATTSSGSSASSSSSSGSVAETEETSADSKKGMKIKGKGKGTQYGPEFLNRVKQIAKNINCNYKDLLAIFNSECGVDAKKVGRNGATGLIGFMPQYYDVAKIRQMTPMQQLDEVEKTFINAKKRAGFADNAKLSKGDLYALIFLPARAQAGNEVLCTKGERGKNGKLLSYYESNAPLDYNKDGKITKSEMAHRIDDKYVSDDTFLA